MAEPGEATGEGCPVLVIPAFLTGDGMTAGLRGALARRGFAVFGWELGINWGPTPRLLAGLDARVTALRRARGALALVGVSLGGMMARHVACERPDDIRHVATIASPIRLPTATRLEPVFRLLARRYDGALDVARLAAPAPVASTTIFTRDDGLVSPESCWVAEPDGEVVALDGAHMTLGGDARTVAALARRLPVRSGGG